MAKGKKTGGRDFQKGHKLGGKPKLPEDIRAARNMSYEEMCRTVIRIRNMSLKDAKKIEMDKIPLGERAILNAYSKLDYKGITEYENRLWGKSREYVDLNTDKEYFDELMDAFRSIK